MIRKRRHILRTRDARQVEEEANAPTEAEEEANEEEEQVISLLKKCLYVCRCK